jgi:glucose/arabinose dehydrogenase
MMGRMARISVVIAAALASLAAPGAASAQAPVLERFPSASVSFSAPYFVTAPPGDTDRVFVVEGAGTIRLVKGGALQPTPFLDISEDVRFAGCGECGLLSAAFAPDYAASGRFYVQYTRDSPVPGQDHHLVTEEFRRSAGDPDVADPASRRLVLEIEHFTASNHNGGQLQFGPDGLLYISTGDGGDTPQNGQSLTTRLGKILRIDPEGSAPGEYSIPPGNPFADGAGPNADEIYAYGLRNPWRFSFDRATGDLALGDVGQGSWEEVDFRKVGNGLGANFGWRCFEGNHVFFSSGECSPAPADHVPPVLEYQNPPGGPAAVVGGYVVRDGSLPALVGRYLYADTYNALGGQIYAADLAESGASGNATLGLGAPEVVSFGEDACARVYVASAGGPVYRMEPESGAVPCDPASPPPPPPPSRDTTAPRLELGLSGARHTAARGALLVAVSCDEECFVAGRALIRIRRKRRAGIRGWAFRAGGDGKRIAAGGSATLRLRLSRRQRAAVRRALRRRARVFARIALSATDRDGNQVERRPRVRQRRLPRLS